MNHQGYQPIGNGAMPPPPAPVVKGYFVCHGSMPEVLGPTRVVTVTRRNGSTSHGIAGSFIWEHNGSGNDVVGWRSYREVEPVGKASDTINRPSHYTNGKIECIDAIEAATTGLEGIEAVCTGNIFKYCWRWKLKNGIEDLKKARWYLDRLIAKVEGGN